MTAVTSLERLERARRADRRLVVGLISGTSVDAAEAALCAIEGSGATVKLELLGHHSSPFEPSLRARILGAQTPAELSELNVLLGERFARAALAVIESAGLTPARVHLVGCHGQTVAHLPPPHATPSTLQLGEPSVIAERLGLPVISDFRSRDLAVGGQGAPLVPYFDWAVFRKPGVSRALQNLGGIGNVSVVSERLEDTIAFDTGPANMLLDAVMTRITHGQVSYDRDGRLAAQGTVDAALLAQMLRHPFFARPPPKSTGREDFGEVFLDTFWDGAKGRVNDLLATVLELTVECTARAYERFVLPHHPLEAMYVSGGGSRNPRMMERLSARLTPLRVERLDVLGFSEAAKEAACFALLASECILGVPQNVPSATGARAAVVLGKIVP